MVEMFTVSPFVSVGRKNTDEYKDSCPTQVEAFRKKATGLIGKLLEDLENQFKDDVKVLCCHTQDHAAYNLHFSANTLVSNQELLHSWESGIQKRPAT